MKRGRVYYAFFLFLIVFVSFVSAVSYGTSFETAKLIGPGIYDESGIARDSPSAYYKIEVPPGKGYKIDFLASGSVDDLSFYDSDRSKLISYDTSSHPVLYFAGYTGQKSSNYYLVLSSSGSWGPWSFSDHFHLVIEPIEVKDSVTGTDIYSDFDNAVLLSKDGPYGIDKAITGATNAWDNGDMYKFDLKKNEKISIKGTPKKDPWASNYGVFFLNLYDQDRKSIASKTSSSGALFSAEYISPKDQTVYFSVAREERDWGGPYSLDVSVEDAGNVELCNAGEKKCSDGNVVKCNTDGVGWKLYSECEKGCEIVSGSAQCKLGSSTSSTKSSSSSYNYYGDYGKSSFFSSSFFWILIVFLVIGLISFVFWLLMFIHCIKNDVENKALWIVLMVFTGIVGAIIYYFVVKRKTVKNSGSKK